MMDSTNSALDQFACLFAELLLKGQVFTATQDAIFEKGPEMAVKDNEQAKAPPRKPVVRKASAKSRAANARSTNEIASQKRRVRRTVGADRSFPEIPTWVGITASVVGAGLAAGFYAWRQYQAGGSTADNFNAAFAGGETDVENFDQTRNAGTASMRSDDEDTSWEDVDEMADASFPASDPPSFNPGTA